MILSHCVVYLLIPTSNHNCLMLRTAFALLYIFWFLHQTTTSLLVFPRMLSLYIFWFLHQTTTKNLPSTLAPGCISFDSYIKPQLQRYSNMFSSVVYLLIPTSNHNINVLILGASVLYIFWFLHQTTTEKAAGLAATCCISFDSYIKPQPVLDFAHIGIGCISFDSYIKPQPLGGFLCASGVVYLLIPTSNHNLAVTLGSAWALYIFWFLHQTTTSSKYKARMIMLYIFWFLHQTTTVLIMMSSKLLLYIFWFLHQTTTLMMMLMFRLCCISFDSYIKPQLLCCLACHISVVYLLIPTSNHNDLADLWVYGELYIFWFLHQTTTFVEFVNNKK